MVGDLRVQPVGQRGGARSHTIVWPDGTVHREADHFLRTHESGTQRTYAYHLVDHLRWLEHECLTLDAVSLRDLHRYMGALGAPVRGPIGEPWRADRRPYGRAALSTAAVCVKGFYVHQAALGVNPELGAELDRGRLPMRADRARAFLGHVQDSVPANPLAPSRGRRRHPKMLPEDARPVLLDTVNTARDRLVITWLADGGFRVGELCGLHLVDLHLREGARCAECRSAHVHICYRPANPNEARAKTKHPWELEDGVIRGGMIRRVSPAMVHTYFEYMTTEYPQSGMAHGMLLVQLHGKRAGQPLTADGVRRVLGRAGSRADLGRITPHAFRHSFATAVLDESNGNLVAARDAGGWASATTVDEVYGHVDLHDLVFDTALRRVWGARDES